MPSRPLPWARLAPWLCVAVGVLGAIGAYLYFVRTAVGQRQDAALAPAGGFGAASQLLAAYDRHVVLAEIGVLGAVVLVAAARHHLWRGLLCAAMPPIVAVEAHALQAVLRRPTFGAAGASAHNSFPSGHVALAAATVVAVILVLPGVVRVPASLLGAALVAVVAVATIAAGWHRFSDGLAGALMAIAAGGAVVLASPGTSRAGDGSEADGPAARVGDELLV
jgi:membrane-associated phospholipid phosphatase